MIFLIVLLSWFLFLYKTTGFTFFIPFIFSIINVAIVTFIIVNHNSYILKAIRIISLVIIVIIFIINIKILLLL